MPISNCQKKTSLFSKLFSTEVRPEVESDGWTEVKGVASTRSRKPKKASTPAYRKAVNAILL